MNSIATSTGAARRTELAAFLRACRERITPDAVGLPPGPRRRTPGLRREEVAGLAGVGVTWYTWLEQGRPINASEQVVDAIARTLRMDEAERSVATSWGRCSSGLAIGLQHAGRVNRHQMVLVRADVVTNPEKTAA